MVRHPPPTRRRAALAAIAGILLLAACGGNPAVDPVASEPPPPPADSAAPLPDPESPPPESESPLPDPESPPPEPQSSPPEPLAIHVDADTIWQDVFDALASSEQSCIRSELDDDLLRSALDRRILTDADSEQWEVSIFTCLTPDNARSLFVATMVAGLQDETRAGELSGEEISCLRDLVAELDVAALVAATLQGEDDPALAEVAVGVLGCVPDVIVGGMFAEMGVDVGDWSAEERSCLRELVAGMDVAAPTGAAGDDAAAAAFGLGLVGCVPDVVVGGMLAEMGVDVGDLSGEERSCLREWVAGVDVVALGSAMASDEAAVAAFGLGLVGCIPDVFLGGMLAEMGVDVGDLSGEELSCLREWVAGVDVVALGSAVAGDEAAVAAFGLGLVGCIPDVFLAEVLADLGLDVGDLSGEELSCLREWVAGVDVDVLGTALAGDEAAVAAFGLGLGRCVPDVFLAEVLGDLGLDVGDLSGEELSCLREWVAGVDVDVLGTALAGDEAAVAAFGLGLGRCVGDLIPPDDHGDPAEGATVAPVDEVAALLGDGSLGVGRIEVGEAIQIRSLNAVTADVAFFGVPIERSVVLAIGDYGPIKGFDVDLGTPLNELCSYDGGQAAAHVIVADEDVIGVIGTSCSGAAVAAVPLITAAGMTMISGGNTSPLLTSDLAGNAGPNYSVGYYRTSHNDLFQSVAMARFAFVELGIDTAAAIHDGGPYTQSLAQAFADAFEREGGTVTGIGAVNLDGIDMVPVLTEIAAGSPGALFFPIVQPAGDFVAAQAPRVPGLENTVLLASDGLLTPNYLALPQTAGMYISRPDTRFGDNVNQSTGTSANDFLTAYEQRYGAPPAVPFWAHGYDATTLLLDAIDAASYLDGDALVVDRQGVRDYLNSVEGYSGLTGTINCDDFGDCGAARITIVQNIGGEANAAASMDNVVFSFSPLGSATAE